MASMEHPVFSISTKPDRNIRRYENSDVFVEVVPSVKGLATVYDRDILIFCIWKKNGSAGVIRKRSSRSIRPNITSSFVKAGSRKEAVRDRADSKYLNNTCFHELASSGAMFRKRVEKEIYP